MDALTSYIYGMSMMFFSMMAWMFWRKGNGLLHRMVMWLMIVVDLQFVKDIAFFYFFDLNNEHIWYLTTALDMMIIPFYSFVLLELVKPGWFRWIKAILLELPFLLLPIFYLLTNSLIWFYMLVVWGAAYGTITFFVLFVLIDRYNRQLKERFSYQENINLNWLRAILHTFFLILAIWIISCFVIDDSCDDIYQVSNLILWLFICYFLYKHESAIDELSDTEIVPIVEETEAEASSMAAEVQRLFDEEKLYLNPKLKLSDVAREVGTNRTYLSRYFNQENGHTFYDFVNNYRIKHAEQLLQSSAAGLQEIADKSGFNSLSTFRRVFAATHGCSPTEYRNLANSSRK